MKSLRETRKRITLFYTFYMVTAKTETITSQIEILNTHASSPIGATVHIHLLNHVFFCPRMQYTLLFISHFYCSHVICIVAVVAINCEKYRDSNVYVDRFVVHNQNQCHHHLVHETSYFVCVCMWRPSSEFIQLGFIRDFLYKK